MIRQFLLTLQYMLSTLEYEIGFLLGKNQVLRQEIKQNILKSMYLYASSKGFYIFRDAKVKSYMQSSTYLKVGG